MIHDKINLLKVDIDKNNKNKDLLEATLQNKESIKNVDNSLIEYRKKMDKIIQSLKNEIKIRTRMKKEKIVNGIGVI